MPKLTYLNNKHSTPYMCNISAINKYLMYYDYSSSDISYVSPELFTSPGEDMFLDLSENNLITFENPCVRPYTFIDADANLECDCRVRYMKYAFGYGESMMCTSPSHLDATKMKDIPDEELTCGKSSSK